jgi:hypothetical protein
MMSDRKTLSPLFVLFFFSGEEHFNESEAMPCLRASGLI